MPSPNPQIDQWARELKNLQRADQIKRFRQRFDKETAQRIIRSPELTPLDRACISLAINFASPPASRFGVHHEAQIVGLLEQELPIPSSQQELADGRPQEPR
jgi:hypothetical protein